MRQKRIPRLETPRLKMRAITCGDLDAYAAMNSDATVMQYLGGAVDRVETWRMMALTLGHWQLRGYGVWAVINKATSEFIGRAGLFNQEGWPGIEATWSITQAYWGMGFATEAGSATLDYAFNVCRIDQVIALVHPDNAPSHRIAEKLGMRFQSTYDLLGLDHRKYAISASEWKSRRP